MLSKGDVIISNNNDDEDSFGLENLARASAAFRAAIDVSEPDHHVFVPALRGLAVAIRRRRLAMRSSSLGQHPQDYAGVGGSPDGKDDGQNLQVHGIFGTSAKKGGGL